MRKLREFRILVTVTILGAVLYGAYQTVFATPLPFREAWWNTGQWDDPFHKRHRIADQLVRHRTLEGKTREEVTALLGPVAETTYFSDRDMVYHLGSERGWLKIDSEWLVLKLDESGVVEDSKIVRD